MALRWPVDNGPKLNLASRFVIFQGIRTSIAKKPYVFVIFKGSGPPVPPGSAYDGTSHMLKYQSLIQTSMLMYPTMLEVYILVWVFINIHKLCRRDCICAGWPEHSLLLDNGIVSKNPCTVSYIFMAYHLLFN